MSDIPAAVKLGRFDCTLLCVAKKSYFVLPAADVFTDPKHGQYVGASRTYTHYNYLRSGPIAKAKRGRFEIALRFCLPEYAGTVAIDMGCADGIFLPSLSKHFSSVVGIDVHEGMLATAADLVEAAKLTNVQLVNSRGLSSEQIIAAAPALRAQVAFLLETLEHVGTPGGGASVYGEKTKFLTDLFDLLKPDGILIVSVPRMVGLGYLLKHLIQVTLRIPHEKVSIGQVLKAGLLGQTDSLEPRWDGGHVGFNDVKLSRLMHENFTVETERTTLISRFFILRRKK